MPGLENPFAKTGDLVADLELEAAVAVVRAAALPLDHPAATPLNAP